MNPAGDQTGLHPVQCFGLQQDPTVNGSAGDAAKNSPWPARPVTETIRKQYRPRRGGRPSPWQHHDCCGAWHSGNTTTVTAEQCTLKIRPAVTWQPHCYRKHYDSDSEPSKGRQGRPPVQVVGAEPSRSPTAQQLSNASHGGVGGASTSVGWPAQAAPTTCSSPGFRPTTKPYGES